LGGQNHRKVDRRELAAPPTASGGVSLAGHDFLRLVGARSSWHHTRADHPLVLSGRAGCELEPTFLLCATVCGRRDDDTSMAQGGDDEDDPDMSLQSTAALGTSPLHDGSGDGSSLEETPSSTAFCLLMRSSFRLRLAISRSLCWALRAARRLSAAALFLLKIASSGRGALPERGGYTSTTTTRRRKNQPE
jgi:hypothetical protein